MKKYRIKEIWVVILVLLLILPACNDNDWLEDNGIQSNGFLAPQSTKDLERMLEGSYWLMGGGGGWQGIHGNQQIPATFMSDEGWLFKENARNDGIDWYNYEAFDYRDDDRYTRAWEAAYDVILQLNTIIERINEEGAFQDAAGPLWTPRILGEAYFLRAYIYHELVKIFGKPYGADNDSPAVILHISRPKSAFDNKGLATVEEVYQQIVSDLNKAIELLPEEANDENGPVPYASPGRAKKDAAEFLAARVYFAMHNYDKALEYANEVLKDEEYELTEDPIESFNKKDFYEKSNEVVWYYINSNGQTRWKPPIQSRYYGYTSDGRGGSRANTGQGLAVADATLKKINWADTTEAKKDKRYLQLYHSHGPKVGKDQGGNDSTYHTDPRTDYQLDERKVWPDKWYRASFEGGWPYALVTSLPLMRSAEMYLTRAILRFMAGDKAGAAEDLNMVKRRAWNEAEGGEFEPVTAEEITAEMIHNERLAEMLFEGDRIYYLQSLEMDIPAGDRETGPHPWQDFSKLPPQDEADKNPLID